MKTGDTTRTFTTHKTHYVIEGYSQQSNRLVYPSEGWSWTDWQPHISTTYETRGRAVSALSGGYLEDMIESQKVVDITIYEVITVTESVEHKCVLRYDAKGNPIEHTGPSFLTSVGDLVEGDYAVVDGRLLCTVESARDGKLYLDVMNGGWTLILASTGPELVIHPDSQGGDPGCVVEISHIGLPDPDGGDDFNHQLDFYRQNFTSAGVTSTKITIPSEPA